MFSVLENFDVGFATNLFVPVDSFNKSDTIKYEIHGLENLPNIPEQNMDVCKKKTSMFQRGPGTWVQSAGLLLCGWLVMALDGVVVLLLNT